MFYIVIFIGRGEVKEEGLTESLKKWRAQPFPTGAYHIPRGITIRTPYSTYRWRNWTTDASTWGAARLSYSLHYYMAAPRASHVRPGFSGDRRFDRRFASIAVEWADKTIYMHVCVCTERVSTSAPGNVPVLCSPINRQT